MCRIFFLIKKFVNQKYRLQYFCHTKCTFVYCNLAKAISKLHGTLPKAVDVKETWIWEVLKNVSS
jgi:hypothetical protein